MKTKLMVIIFLVVLTLIEIFGVTAGEHYPWWQKIKGIHLAYGLIGGPLLLLAAKSVLGKLLYRKENYYDA